MLLPTLKGEKINLRRLKKTDAESIYQNIKYKEISRFTFIPHPYKLNDALVFIKSSHLNLRAGKAFHFGIEEKTGKTIIGCIGLDHVNFQHRQAELGYWVSKQYWGQGIGCEAVKLILKFGFENLALNRICARVMHPNTASFRLLEKTGFKKEGTMRQAVLKEGDWLDCYWYSILASEFKDIKKNQ